MTPLLLHAVQAAAALSLQQFKQVLARPDLDEVSPAELIQLQGSFDCYCQRAEGSAGSEQEAMRWGLELQLAVKLLLESEGLHSALKAAAPSFKSSTTKAPISSGSGGSGCSAGTQYSLLLKLLDTVLMVRHTGTAVTSRLEATCLPVLKHLFKEITSFCQLPMVRSSKQPPATSQAHSLP